MKIAYIIRHFELGKFSMVPKIGYNYAELISKKHKIDIITSNKIEKKVIINNNLRVISKKNIFKFLNHNNYDIVHYWGGFTGLLLHKFINHNKKVVIANVYTSLISTKDFRNLKFIDFLDKRLILAIKRRLIEFLLLFLFKRKFKDTVLIVNSKEQKKFLSKYLKTNKTFFIPHGLFTQESKIGESYKNNNNSQVLYLGHPYKIRGIDLIIRVAPKLIKNNPEIKFIFILSTIQDGKLDHIKNLIKEKIPKRNYKIISGFVKDVYFQYKKANLLVLPYKTGIELPPIPLVLLEGLNSGLSVITTDVNSILELLPNKKLIICKRNSEADLLKKIQIALIKNVKPKNKLNKFKEKNLTKFLLEYYTNPF